MILKLIGKFLFFCFVQAFFVFVVFTMWMLLFFASVPNIENVTTLLRKPHITIYDAEENVLAMYGDIYGKTVHIKDLPKHLISAVLSVEDRRFYSHIGIDPRSIIRSFIENFKSGSIVQGGSTITQQLSRNFLQNSGLISMYDQSYSRKLKEAIIALLIEQRFSKDEILSMYLNRIYFGGGVYGVDGAAEFYFGKSAKDLSLYESVLLVGLLKAPSTYAPHLHYDLSLIRAKEILNKLVKYEEITLEEMEATLLLSAPPLKKNYHDISRYFTDWVIQQHLNHVPRNCDLRVFTTLNPTLQKYAEQAVKDMMQEYGKMWNMEEGALVVLDPQGAVLAMVGNSNYNKFQFNVAAYGNRQMGSCFKYFVYATAMDLGYDPDDITYDDPIQLGTWQPNNAFDYDKGEVTLSFAFAKSINTAAVRVLKQIGIRPVYKRIKIMDILDPKLTLADLNYTLTLGTFETTLLRMAGGLTPMLNDGKFTSPYAVRYITSNHKILDAHESSFARVFQPSTVDKMRILMKNAVKIGTARAIRDLNIDKVYAKSGTTQDYHDLAAICILDKNQFDLTPDGLLIAGWSGVSYGQKAIENDGKHLGMRLIRRFLELIMNHGQNNSKQIE